MRRGETSAGFFAGGDPVVLRLREIDWVTTPLGPPDSWSQSLKTVVRIMLTSRFAMWLAWGPELTFFCNNAYRPTLGVKFPWALGQPASSVWAEIWPEIGPRIETVLTTGVATWDEALMLFLERSGYAEETYHTFSYSPVTDDDGEVRGMLCVVSEESERVVGERRLLLLRELAADLAVVNTEADVLAALSGRLTERSHDVPFSAVYLFSEDRTSARRGAASNLVGDGVFLPETVQRDGIWPVEEMATASSGLILRNLHDVRGTIPTGPWDVAPAYAAIVPLAQPGQELPAGFLIVGLNPYRPFDADYAGFVELLAGQAAAKLASAHAYEAELRRAEELAKLDRAKTAFFSNVSHELRTPLTLMLGPLEDALGSDLDGRVRKDLDLAHRNALRLLKQVNTLLDFSRLEAGRTSVHKVATNLGALTSDLASNFRSAVERNGLQFSVDTPDSPVPVYVDRDFWEKIVLNLLSNALKYTLEGEIGVRLVSTDVGAELRVRDTGTGISPEDQARLFERFFRVDGAIGRTHEGTGIGLALVSELTALLGGSVRVESELGVGSEFIVTIPRGTSSGEETVPEPEVAKPRFDEASLWTLDPDTETEASAEVRPRVLVADDNADMRQYLRHLLAPSFDVEVVADGELALESALRQRPDLILTDVMMPQRDGFGLLRAIREDGALRDVPVIMLSARAGEEAKVDGLDRGADDYLVKPFAARELLARVRSNLELAKQRRVALDEQVRLRREAEVVREQLELVLGGIREVFLVLDAEARVVYASRSFVVEDEGEPRHALGENLFDLIPGLDQTDLPRALEQVRTTGDSSSVLVHYQTWDRWYDNRLSYLGDGRVALFSTDVTERVGNENRLRLSESRLRRFAESLPQIAWHCLPDGRVEWFNSRFYEFTGMAEAEALGMGWFEQIAPADRATALRAWSEAMRSEQPCTFEARVRRRDGEMRWFLIHCTPTPPEGAVIEGWYGSATEIHDQKELEQELERRVSARTQDLVEANRQMEGFTYTVSHDLRAPLRAIVFNCAVLKEEVGDQLEPFHRELLDRQSDAALRLAALIDDLLKLSRLSRQEMRWNRVDLTAIAHDVIEELGERPSKPLEFRVASPLTTEADPQLIRFVLLNLIENAAKFSPEGGLIEVGRTGDAFFVRDHGIGFDPSYAEKIFEPFERLVRESDFAGTGIGLANVKRIVERHHGRVWAESRPGEGATFYFTIGAR